MVNRIGFAGDSSPVFDEIATSQDGRDITQLWMGPLRRSQDTVLLTRGGYGSQALELYEEVLRDDQVASCFQQRRLALICREWDVRPGRRRFMEPTAQDIKAAEFAKEMIDQCLEFDDLTAKMHYAVILGYGVAEAIWARDGRYVVFDDTQQGIKAKKARRFDFTPDGELRLLTIADQWQGEPVPANKFWTISFGGDNDDHPAGLGLGHYLYWPTYFKRAGMQAWLKFLEKAGIPSRVGKYPAGTNKQQQDLLLDATERLGSDSAAIIPEGMTIELLESARTVADFTSLYDKMNEAIAKVILNQTFTSEGAGGQYKGDNLVTVRNEVTKSDADLICQSFNRQPLAWLIDYNRSALGDDVAVPMVWRDMSEEEDLDKTADTWTKIYALGFDPDESAVQDKFGQFWRKRSPSPAALPEMEEGAGVVEMARQPEPQPDTVDVWAERVRGQAGPEIDGWLRQIQAELDDATDLAEFGNRLLEMFPELSGERFARLVGDALYASNLAGYYESQLEQEE